MSEAKVTISAEDRFSRVVREAHRQFDTLSSTIGRLGITTASLGGAFGILGSLSVGGAVAGLTSLIGAIDDLDERAQGLGITAVALADLQAGAIEAGVGADNLDAALSRLNARLGDAVSGNQQAAQLFRALGVEVRDAGGKMRGTDEVLRDVADRFAQLEDDPAKAALAMELFGRSGSKLVAFLNQGGAGLARFSGQTDETVAAATRAQQALDRWTLALGRLKTQGAGELLPGLVDFVERFADASSKIDRGSAVPGFVQLISGYQEAAARAEQRQRQLTEALRLGEGAYSNEGRSARQSAEAILANARAKDENTAANKRNRESSLASVFQAEFRDAQRIRENRRRLGEAVDDDNRAAEAGRQQRIDDIFGVSEARETSEILRIINEEVRAGRRSADEAEAAWDRVFGKPMQDKLKETSDAAEMLSVAFASSLGRVIEGGGSAGDVFKALLQDIAKLIVQLTIIKPLADDLKRIFTTGGGGSGWWGTFLSLFNGAAGAGFTGGQSSAGIAKPAGAEPGPRAPVVFNFDYSGMTIGAGASRAEIAAAMERSSELAIAKIEDRIARGRLRVA